MPFSTSLLFFLGICFVSGAVFQNNEDRTLIYHFDKNHKMYLYCQFASAKVLQTRHISYECFSRNKNMQHILNDGTITFPYLAHGSSDSFILQCGDIPRGKLHQECDRNVYSNCSYTCQTSDVIHFITCNLMGPLDNVTAQWSIKEPCGELAESISTSSPDADAVFSGIALTTRGSNAGPMPEVTDASSTVLVPYVSPGNNQMTTIIIICIVIVIIIIAGFGILIFCLRKGKIKNCLRLSISRSREENGPDDIPGQNCQQTPFLAAPSEQQEVVQVVDENANTAATVISPEYTTELRQGSAPQEHITPPTGFAELGLSSPYDYTYNMESRPKASIGNKKITEALQAIVSLNCDSVEANIVLGELIGTASFSKSSKGKNLLIEDPDACNASVELLRNQTNSYRKRLRPELEVIAGRSREQALIGYMEENAQALGCTRNGIKLLERTYEQKVEEKVSDEFLEILAGHGVKIGCIMKYFYTHKNTDAITAILEVHAGCDFCEQFKSLINYPPFAV